MARLLPTSDFLNYLAAVPVSELPGGERVPSLADLSQELGTSVSSLREQLEVARALGFVEVRPRTGIRRLPYSFLPAVQHSLAYALQSDRAYFDLFADLRRKLEAAFWYPAVRLLTPEDHACLRTLVEQAWNKLNGSPVHIPQDEHRRLHLAIYCRLGNPFVTGILEAYWDAYETVGLNLFADYNYLQQVWRSHEQMVEAICSGDYDAGYQALVEHTDLLYQRAL
jgi:DNA-binding FadR family transcriptional regulator